MSDATPQDGLIADSVARLFADHVDNAARDRAEAGSFDAVLWQRVSDGGFAMMLATEAAGGLGQDWAAAYPVLRGLGAWQVPLPLAETMVAAQLLSQAGLPVPDGPLTLIEQGRGNTLQAREDGAARVLSGVAHGVPWARHAHGAVVSLGAAGRVGSGRLALLDLRAGSAVTLQPHANAAGLPSDTLVLHEARCTAVAPNPLPLAEPVWTLGAVARCAMMVGALEWTLEQSVRYAGERVQFGRPIGKNQAIQQNLALMAGDVAAARMAARVAAADVPGVGVPGVGAAAADAAAVDAAGRTALFSAAVAKVRCGEAATRGTGIAHQVHGAIGFTHEHALHYATRRLWAWREEFGTDAFWAGRLGRAAIGARAAGFWPSITDGRFAALR